jgi:hypothetical protein
MGLIGMILFLLVTSALFRKDISDAMGGELISLLIWLLACYAITQIFWLP